MATAWQIDGYERHGSTWMARVVREVGGAEECRFVPVAQADGEVRRMNAEAP